MVWGDGMAEYVWGLERLDKTNLASAGGKAANLGELTRVAGVRVPAGFCVTTGAYAEAVTGGDRLAGLLEELSRRGAHDVEGIRATAVRIREAIETAPVPSGIAEEIGSHLGRLGDRGSYAVRSSATAEDLPTASFAGQQDTYLNVSGSAEVLRHVRRCWASVFNDRAISYRLHNGIDHRSVQVAVIVQRMIFSEVAGVMFTADPLTSDRKTLVLDAGFGLGEALVSGLTNPDSYAVRGGRIVDKKVSEQAVAVRATSGGGTEQDEVEVGRRSEQKLPDDDILRLAATGKAIEAHFGCPQDIEWSLADDTVFIVQSRPITTLFPVPGTPDGRNHVYMSFGHQQMMTDAMKPLGLSFFQAQLEETPLSEAAGRFYIDLGPDLASAIGRRTVLAAMGRIDPLMDSGLRALTRRKDFMKGLARGGRRYFRINAGYFSWRLPLEGLRLYLSNDPARVSALTARHDAAVEDLRHRLANRSGDELFEAILDDLRRDLKNAVNDPRSMAVVFTGLYALSWLNRHMKKWLGVKGAGDGLARFVANDVTAEMGLALLDVADCLRAHPAVVAALPNLPDTAFFTALAAVEGGDVAGRAIQDFLDRYGMRCPGEIDVTRPRWSEEPSTLVPVILGTMRNLAGNVRAVRVERSRLEAEQMRKDLLDRLERLPGGRRKANRTRTMISRLQNFAGYREYPKYLMMRHFWILKQAMLTEAAALARRGAIQQPDDVHYLSLAEFREAVRTGHADPGLIARRREDFDAWKRLVPPRLITSDGEVPSGTYEGARVPAGALAGIPASAGTAEGRARVVHELAEAQPEEGDILVTTFTDPSWTPVFLSVTGLVTEVGGAMTHGAVVAREYGLPAVVGVEGATRLIRDGQRIRIDGTDGYVQLL
jgi:phosphoenolpyruvate synthase/pyruvate phosphate dikinase